MSIKDREARNEVRMELKSRAEKVKKQIFSGVRSACIFVAAVGMLLLLIFAPVISSDIAAWQYYSHQENEATAGLAMDISSAINHAYGKHDVAAVESDLYLERHSSDPGAGDIAYRRAISLLKARQYPLAKVAFDTYLSEFPGHEMAPEAGRHIKILNDILLSPSERDLLTEAVSEPIIE